MEYSGLWQFVQGLTPGAPLAPAEVQIALTPFSDKLLHLIKFKVRPGQQRAGHGTSLPLIWRLLGACIHLGAPWGRRCVDGDVVMRLNRLQLRRGHAAGMGAPPPPPAAGAPPTAAPAARPAAQGPSDDAKRQVQAGRVVTPTFGEVLLDPEPDQKLVRGLR
jgi:hypothetical protein